MGAIKPPEAMEFLVADPEQLKRLQPGQSIAATVRRQGRDFVLDDLRAVSPSAHGN